MPALGMSLFLLSIGLVLAFAVNATVAGLDIIAIGLVLAGVGAFGVVLSMLYLFSVVPFAPPHPAEPHHDHRDPPRS